MPNTIGASSYTLTWNIQFTGQPVQTFATTGPHTLYRVHQLVTGNGNNQLTTMRLSFATCQVTNCSPMDNSDVGAVVLAMASAVDRFFKFTGGGGGAGAAYPWALFDAPQPLDCHNLAVAESAVLIQLGYTTATALWAFPTGQTRPATPMPRRRNSQPMASTTLRLSAVTTSGSAGLISLRAICTLSPPDTGPPGEAQQMAADCGTQLGSPRLHDVYGESKFAWARQTAGRYNGHRGQPLSVPCAHQYLLGISSTGLGYPLWFAKIGQRLCTLPRSPTSWQRLPVIGASMTTSTHLRLPHALTAMLALAAATVCLSQTNPPPIPPSPAERPSWCPRASSRRRRPPCVRRARECYGRSSPQGTA